MTGYPAPPPKPRSRLALAAAILGLVSLFIQAIAFGLMVHARPLRPSLLRITAEIGVWFMLAAFILLIASAIRGRRARNLAAGSLATVLILSSCVLSAMLAGPPGELLEFKWDHAPDENVSATTKALRQYAGAHGAFPTHLADIDNAILPAELRLDPVSRQPLRYIGAGVPGDSDGDIVILYAAPVAERTRSVVSFADGHVESIANDKLPAVFDRSNAARRTLHLPLRTLDDSFSD